MRGPIGHFILFQVIFNFSIGLFLLFYVIGRSVTEVAHWLQIYMRDKHSCASRKQEIEFLKHILGQ